MRIYFSPCDTIPPGLPMIQYFIGTSGWHYPHWQGSFYPAALPKDNWLSFYARTFSTVELNNTFYRQPTEKAVQNWRLAAPDGFKFAVKASRFITHIKRLNDAAEPMQKFFDGLRPLSDRLGPVLFQLPPNFHRDDARLNNFIKLLPESIEHAVEFRHASWIDNEVLKILHRYNVAFCVYDMPGVRTPVVATADFAYVRFHGNQSLYGGSYSEDELASWAKEIKALPVARAYIYFNNDAGGYAVDNALTLKRLLE